MAPGPPPTPPAAAPPPLPASLRRVLVVQTDHHLGNTALSLPVVAALGAHFCRGVDLLVDARYAGVVGGVPGVRRVRSMPAQRDGFGNKRRGIPATALLLARLAARRYEAVIDLAGGVRTGILVRAAGWATRERVGFLQARRPGAYTRTIDAPDTARTGTHFFDRYARTLACIGRDPGAPWPPPVRLRPTDADHAAGAAAIAHAFPDAAGPLVVLHPAAGIAWRCWPPERFAAVARGLVARRDARVLIVGVDGDRERAEAIIAAAAAGPGGAATGRVAFASRPLPVTLAVLAAADLLVSNESGPTHLAAAAGTPVVTVFGPTDETRWRPLPLSPDRLDVLRGSACDPGCHGRTCVSGRRCLLSLSADAVLAAACDMLDRAPKRPLPTFGP
ncbi:glycosyltransferase family 9 protein [Phycisphaera mikurensis]|uniref:Putative glycosyltransferase n=1 Tax=Phycisphaera mikurensis (strain NBRC 102666 / KCTC 22515 / FYK2301M01) TaxID=1142394 RepID=I0IAB8_PHYMF|nr:glycosyltransferase family 9 protein [Phycisphaera mikurensis]MBB6441795.1 ADP-heptose:LPS heptosyltransferase [Phycisphaera mikurensis]BAM02206.1 putative glycosyltransferase [Phycisphaera mikurensis NBRC 102666]